MNRSLFATAVTFTVGTTIAHAAIVTGGNFVVSQVGDGSAALTSAATAVFIKEFTTTPASPAVQSVAVPTSGAFRQTNSGSATSELQLSLNDGFLGLSGYDAAPGTLSVAGTSTSGGSPVLRRAIAYDITADLVTGPAIGGTTTSFTGNNIRAATPVNGSLYTGGAATGIVLITNGGSGTGTIVSTTTTNNRAVENFNDNIYYSTGSGTSRGVYEITGEPTTTGANTATLLISTGATSSPYAFWLNAASDLAYIADDRTTAGTGGIQKWRKIAGVWTFDYAITTDYDLAGTATTGTRGIAVDSTGTNPLLYFISLDGTRVGSVTDTGTAAGSDATLSVLQTAPTNTLFRDVAIPEPAGLSLLALAGLMGLRRRR
ncbi:MAG: hypothetical protein H7144_12635 [Burkholderiales bacterium]|nr:hypothetical protein [Phycisphaerae bacterium]